MKIVRSFCFLIPMLLLIGCATTPKIDWNSRIGNYSYDNAVVELGPPDKSAVLSDGTRVAEWLVRRGYSRGGTAFGMGGGFYGHPYYYGGPIWFHEDPPSPDVFLRLVFDAEGILQEWKRYYR